MTLTNLQSHPSSPESLTLGRERVGAHGGPSGLKAVQVAATHPKFSPMGRMLGNLFTQRLWAENWLRGSVVDGQNGSSRWQVDTGHRRRDILKSLLYKL